MTETTQKTPVRLGGLTLGHGRAAVCVPLMGQSARDIAGAAHAAAEAGADLVELRLDSLSPCPAPQETAAAAEAVREARLPVLLTLRTAREGGAGTTDPAAYEALLRDAAKRRLAEALDVELGFGEALFRHVVETAHANGLAVVGSCHHFDGTPPQREMTDTLLRAAAWGADIAKIAVMPKNRQDVLALMQAALAADEATDKPLIAIAMGSLGAVTRIACGLTGSCLTFASVGAGSAPGQIAAGPLRQALRLIEG